MRKTKITLLPIAALFALALFAAPALAASSSNYHGSAPVRANARSTTVHLPDRIAGSYAVQVTPNWNANCWWTRKTPTSFLLTCATPAPADGSGAIDWSVER